MLIFIVFSLIRLGIEPKPTFSAADALSTQPLIAKTLQGFHLSLKANQFV